MRVHFSLLLIVGANIILLGLSEANVFCGAEDTLRVELDVFSGRENPTWILSAQDERVFIEKFRSLPKIKGEVSGGNALGYRGLIVRGRSIEDIKDISVGDIKIYNETVSAIIENNASNYSDPGRVLELWLIKTAEAHIEDKLYESILAEVTD
jgi:hypothetical protein